MPSRDGASEVLDQQAAVNKFARAHTYVRKHYCDVSIYFANFIADRSYAI